MEGLHMPSMEGVKMTLKKHQCQVIKALQHAESNVESMVSNAELPFTSLIKSSVLPSHSSKMKKISPDQGRRRNFAAKLQEARQRQETKKEAVVSPQPKVAAKKVESEPESEEGDDDDDDDDGLPEVQVMSLDFTEDLFGAEKLSKDDIDWVYKEAAASLLLPVSEHRVGQLHDEMRDEILLSECEILRDAFDKDSRNHRRLAQGSVESNNNLLHRLGDTLTSLESKPHFTRDDFPDADGFETWKKQQREKLKSMISTLTQLPDYVGRLHIRVHGARDLPGAEGKVNALCKVQVTKKDKCKTSEVRSLSPTWDEEFKVELTQPFEAVEASVWNKVKLALDQCFGVALVPYQDLELQLPWEDWFPLLPPDEKKLRSRKQAGGEVNLALHLIHNKRPLMGNNHSYTTGPEWERWERRRARNRDDLPLHYEGYMVLLRTLVQLENPSLASTLSLTNFPLSEPSAWLLEEFAERHLIPSFYTKLAYLSIITKVFEVRKEYLTHVITTLRTLMELQRSDVWFTTTTQERDLFYVTVRDLREEVRQVLLQYHRKLNNFVIWAEEETKKSAQRHISPAQLQKLQVESAVEALTDLLGILLDLLWLIPPIPDKYATASKAGQSSDEVALVSPRKSSATAVMKSSGNNKGGKAAGPKPTLKQEIAEWIEEGINIRFGKFQARLLRVAEIKLKRRGKAEEEDEEGSGETKEGVIADICDHIVSSLNKDERYYQQPFLKLGGVDVVERALFLYYPHIKVAVTEWLQGGTEDPPLTDRTFDVYFALRKLHQLMSQYDRQEKQQLLDIDKLFLPFVDKYLTQCREKLKEWSQTAFKNDDWMPIDSEEEDDELRILHSASVISLFSAMRQAVQFLLLLNLNLFPSLLHFTKTVGEVVDYYLSKLEKSVASTVIIPAALPDDDVQRDEKVDKRKTESAKRSSKRQTNNKLGKVAAALRTKPAGFDAEDVSKLPTTVNQELCIKINNVETIVKQLAGLMKDLHAKLTTKEDKAELARIFGGIFSAVELRYNQIIAIITSHMNDSIKQVIYYLLEGGASEEKRIKEIEKQERKDRKDSKDKSQALLVSQPSEQLLSLAEERVEYFFQYLNSEVGVLSDHLYFDAFSILLAHVWTVIVKDFEELLLPVSAETDRYGPRNRPRIAKMLEYIVTQLLFEFFEADGDGLEREYLESTTVLLRRAIALYELETSVLKSIYRGIEKKHETEQTKDDLKADPLEEWHVLCILTARPGDKEAQEFVTAKRASARNQTIRRFFKLSKNDQLIAEFECNNADKIRGRLYLSTSSLCFEPLVDARKLIISIQQITFVARNKHVSFPDAIQITADKEDYAFWSFASNRSEECYEMLIAQARLLGNTSIVPYEEISAADDVSRIQISHHPISPRNVVSPRRRERTKTITNSKHQSEKEEELLALFNLPDDETLMQQYGCVLKSKASSGPGRLLIFRSHFCFLPSVGSSLVNVAAAEVKSVTKKRTAILLPNALSITTRAGAKYAFHSLKRNEAYSIMREQMEQATEETRQRGGKTKKK